MVTKGSLPDGVPSDNSKIFRKGAAASFRAENDARDPGGSQTPPLTPSRIVFSSTNTATPKFSEELHEDGKSTPATSETGRAPFPGEGALLPKFSRVIVEVDDDEEDDDEDGKKNERALLHGPHLPAPMLILIAIGFLLAALGVYVASQNQEPQPYCSQQPDWNQFNCIPD